MGLFRRASCLLSLFVTSLASVAQAAPGDLDPTFGIGGVVTTSVRFDNFDSEAGAYAVAMLADGGMLAVGGDEFAYVDFAIVRWRSDGVLDPGFGIGGRVLTDFADEGASARGVVARDDGTFIVAGSARIGGATHIAIAGYLANGQLDASFGTGGKVVTAVGEHTEGTSIAIQPDGKIVVGGRTTIAGATHFALARYDATGTLDPSFDGDGIATLPILGTDDAIHALALQPDGKVVAGGDAFNGTKRVLALARFHTDGALDTSFGINGTATTSVSSRNDSIFAVAVQGDGRLIVAGSSYLSTDVSDDIVLARYLPDGTLDPGFGNAGTVLLDLSEADDARAVDLLDSGKILVAGTAYNEETDLDFLLLRLHPDGSLDTSFDEDGIVTTAIDIETIFSGPSRRDGGSALGLGADGTITIVGTAWNGLDRSVAAARYAGDGSLDPNFGNGGITSAEIAETYDSLEDMIILADGRVVSAGSSFDGIRSYFALTRHNPDGTSDASFGSHGRVVTGPEFDPAVFGWAGGLAKVFPLSDGKLLAVGTSNGLKMARYHPDGALDTSFGIDGVTEATLGSPTAVAMQDDGKVVVAGSRRPPSQNWFEFFVVRLNPSGDLDPTFGDAGAVSTPIGVANSFANALAIQQDGKLVAAGRASESFAQRFALARYNVDGSLDPTFDGDGIVFTTELSGATINALAIQPDGKLVAAGQASKSPFGVGFAVARYNTDGSLDASFDGDGTVVMAFDSTSTYDEATNVLLQPDGKIVIVGMPRLNGAATGFAIARLHPDGSLDESFGSEGSTVEPTGRWWPSALVMQSDGRLVVAGTEDDRSADAFALARYDLGPIGGDCMPLARNCRSAAKSSLLVRDKTDDRRDKLVWKWTRGEAINVNDLGDPTVDAGYSLCFYDHEQKLMPAATLRIPAGSAWSAAGDRGFDYREKSGASDGVQRALVRGSDTDRAKALLKSRGAGLPAIVPPLPVPLTVQLVNERNGECLGSTFEEGDIVRNDDGRFKASRR